MGWTLGGSVSPPLVGRTLGDAVGCWVGVRVSPTLVCVLLPARLGSEGLSVEVGAKDVEESDVGPGVDGMACPCGVVALLNPPDG